MPGATLAIVNPASRNGATRRSWGRIEPQLRRAFAELEVEFTRGRRDAERIAREAVRAGVERLIVAGGDGTTSEVVSGLLAADLGGSAQLGVLPLGTGGDLARMLELPRDMEKAIEALRHGATRQLDAGRIHYQGRDGVERTSYFLNVASFGISGLVDELVDGTTKMFGGTFSFLIGTLRGLLRYRSPEVRVSVDGDVVHAGRLVLAAVANGRFFGGGMFIAPDSRPDDGKLDVVIIGEMSKARLIAKLPSLYRGTHITHSLVSVYRGTRIEAEAPRGEVWLDIDGEALGSLPARIEVLPGAVTLFGVDASR